uniref:Uncharacterized protein n=1 Tax=Heterorhabditis bacteriophora TaxID=37862 RepID=A0A1I7X579_HETBA
MFTPNGLKPFMTVLLQPLSVISISICKFRHCSIFTFINFL